MLEKDNMRKERLSQNKHSKKKSVNSLTFGGYVSTPSAPDKCIKVNPSMPSIKEVDGKNCLPVLVSRNGNRLLI